MALKSFSKVPSLDRVTDQNLDTLGKLHNIHAALLNGNLTVASNLNQELLTVSITTPTSTTGAFANGYPFAEYTQAGVQSIPTNAYTVVNYSTLVTDTDAAVTTGASWHWTCPIGKGGVYQVSGSVGFQAGASSGDIGLDLFKNGSAFRRGMRVTTGSASFNSAAFSGSVLVAAGDTIDLRAFQTFGGVSRTLDASSFANWFSIQALNLTTQPVQSCFPLLLNPAKVKSPKLILVGGVTDTSTSPTVPALETPSWTINTQGQLYLTNLPGLLLGRTYSISLLLVGG